MRKERKFSGRNKVCEGKEVFESILGSEKAGMTGHGILAIG